MKKIFLTLSFLMLLYCSATVQAQQYKAAFMGDSITNNWKVFHETVFFNVFEYKGVGISGQVTMEMLQRFEADVISIHPKAVVIMAGTNDIAQNRGYVPLEQTVENIMAMADMATKNGIKVAICTITPVETYSWKPQIDPVACIRTVNSMLEELCFERGYTWIDYYSAMVNGVRGFNTEFCTDRVHPLVTGYELLEQLVQPYLAELVK